jgi:hypothetical protein
VQSTAGVRALGALFGLIALVVIIAVLINLITGDEPSTATTLTAEATSTTAGAVQVENPAPLDILTASCTPEGLGGDFSCTNLIDGNAGSFQVNYNELPEGEKEVEMRLTFPQPMEVTRICWTNLEEEARFRRNYRAKGITLEAEGNPFVVPQELQDAAGEQCFDFATIRANFIIVTVQSVYQAEVFEGTEPFDELAIEEITVIGHPADTTTNTSAAVTTSTTGG